MNEGNVLKAKKHRENTDDGLSSIELYAIFFYQYKYELHFVLIWFRSMKFNRALEFQKTFLYPYDNDKI